MEELVFQLHNCVRVLVSIPSPRKSIINWLDRRGYLKVGEIPYPFQQLNHVPLSREEIKLLLFVKPCPDDSDQGPEQSHLPPIFRQRQPNISDCPFREVGGDVKDFGID